MVAFHRGGFHFTDTDYQGFASFDLVKFHQVTERNWLIPKAACCAVGDGRREEGHRETPQWRAVAAEPGDARRRHLFPFGKKPQNPDAGSK